jgi:protein-S-isoprenylcysteine O-methyltransferase Ste14
MTFLELRIPPPVVALLMAALMWLVAETGPTEPAGLVRSGLATAAAVLGLAFNVAGMLSFRRARTTLNPMKPDAASALVTTGIYRITRNPMYVGGLLLLVGWGVYLRSAAALIGPVLFFAYITRFQIIPEERVLTTMFGDPYTSYRARVRRWL